MLMQLKYPSKRKPELINAGSHFKCIKEIKAKNVFKIIGLCRENTNNSISKLFSIAVLAKKSYLKMMNTILVISSVVGTYAQVVNKTTLNILNQQEKSNKKCESISFY